MVSQTSSHSWARDLGAPFTGRHTGPTEVIRDICGRNALFRATVGFQSAPQTSAAWCAGRSKGADL
eukprot:3290466-Prorocentrum_lima.AAC.1